MQQRNQLRGLTLNDGMDPQKHKKFIDDNMLMGPSSVQEPRGIKKGLYTFLEASWLEINIDKSQVYFFNTLKTLKEIFS